MSSGKKENKVYAYRTVDTPENIQRCLNCELDECIDCIGRNAKNKIKKKKQNSKGRPRKVDANTPQTVCDVSDIPEETYRNDKEKVKENTNESNE